MGLNPRYYVFRREHKGWKNLHSLRLTIPESTKLEEIFNISLKETGLKPNVKRIKYGNGSTRI
jgi:hypothetical protein